MTADGWYLICCKYGRIKQAEASLSRIGVKIFCPVMKCEKNRTDSKNPRSRIVPMFPPYLFVSFNPELIPLSKINTLPGVNYFVRFGSEPKPLPQALIDVLMMKSCRSIFSDQTIDYDDRLACFEEKINKIQYGRGPELLALLQDIIREESENVCLPESAHQFSNI